MRRIMTEDTGLKLLLILCIPGLIDSIYLTYGHYKVRELTDGGTVCPANTEGWACNDVLISEYSEIMGIPVALIGLIGLVLISTVALWRFLAMDLPSTRWNPLLLSFMCTGGLGVTSWLTYAEVFILHEICPFCFFVFIITILLEVVAVIMYMPDIGKLLKGDMTVSFDAPVPKKIMKGKKGKGKGKRRRK